MRLMKYLLASLLVLLFSFSTSAQQMGYDVFGVATHPYAEPYQMVTLDSLQEAKTLSDVNARYRGDWVARYISVALTTDCDGTKREAVGPDDVLTPQQLELLHQAGPNCKVDVLVDYIPDNKLQHNPPRQMNFSLRIMPIFEAKFPGGTQQLKAYLKKNFHDEILAAGMDPIKLVRVRFQVGQEGQAADTRIVQSSGNSGVDQLIENAICNMPIWLPAKDAQGRAITQEFEFTMGTDLLRCDYQY